MKLIHLNNNFIAQIPNNWDVKITQDVISLFEPLNGLGVIQFSFYKVQNADSLNLTEELDEYLKDKYGNINANLINDYAYFNIVSFSGIFWRYWLLRKAGNIIFISYNCAKEDINKEDDTIDNIIRSIEIQK